ncbi:transcription antitermination factor NusB [Dehalobacterium formicoaceticum]|uniref:Transcription antitermination protein NusB n=1 Tax=Dehalobacterium formicoaceticum TaxID=51515 RepID=A0ABT1Y512_9FIRM|nr:transcription antitermination factor NusB [Dehalobacterium formicoaceticum]MCR6545954.1 transcription antitermination factor NusB [Dehalobacterium formicoaceticum]
MSRRLAREKALQMLFQMDVGQNSLEMAKLTLLGAEISPQDESFVLKLVDGTRNCLEELDTCINQYAEEWDIGRMAKVDKNLLRMALYEMKYLEDIPHSVTINEAIDLAKKFGSEESGKFVNGILDKIQKESDFLKGRL